MYEGAAKHLQDVWIAVRVSLRRLLEEVTLADIASGHLPPIVGELGRDRDAWVGR